MGITKSQARAIADLLRREGREVSALLDTDDVVVWVSADLLGALDLEADSMLGRHVSDLLHPDQTLDWVPGPDEDRARGGRPHPLLVRARTGHGGYRWLLGNVTASAPTGELHGAVVVRVAPVDDDLLRHLPLVSDRTRLQATLQSLLDPLVVVRPVAHRANGEAGFALLEANDAARRELGLVGLDGEFLEDRFAGFAESGLALELRTAVAAGRPLRRSGLRCPQPHDQGTRVLDVSAVQVMDALSITWRDVTAETEDRDALLESERRFRLLAENATDIVLRVEGSRVQWASPSLTRALGWTPDDWTNTELLDWIHPDDRTIAVQFRRTVDAIGPARDRFRARHADGTHRWVDAHAAPLSEADEPAGYVVSWRTIDAQVAAEQEMAALASLDPLTGLLNRRSAFAQLAAAVVGRQRRGREVAVVYCDLDGFKHINDRYGHAVGDEVLIGVARRLRSAVRNDDVVARIGGDEFLVALRQVIDRDATEDIVRKLHDALSEPLPTRAGAVRVAMSTGVALAADDRGVEDLLAEADAAMYAAKHRARRTPPGTDT